MPHRDTNFYYSFLALSPAKRRAILAVWDFCRAVDDAVDERRPVEGNRPEDQRTAAREELRRWRDELARCFDGAGPKTSEGRLLQPAIRRFGLPRRAFEEVIDGVEMDLDRWRYETFASLSEYCRRVASAVGLICVEIFGYRHDAARAYAADLGMALQLTNILRDIPSDRTRGRLYVPMEDLARFGCTEDDLAGGPPPERVRALLKYECDRARSFFDKARRELPRPDARRLVAAEMMRAIYFTILERIETAQYDVFSRPIRVPRSRRAWIAAATWVKTMAGHAGA